MAYAGRVVEWHMDRGSGYIQPQDGSTPIFLHISSLRNPLYQPRVGEIISYDVLIDQQGRKYAWNALIQGQSDPEHLFRQQSHKASSAGYDHRPLHHGHPYLLPFFIIGILWLGLFLFVVIVTYTVLPVSPYKLWLVTGSIVLFLVYGFDKIQANRSGARIPEHIFHVFTLAGGFWGAFIGRWLFRHHIRKLGVLLIILLSCILHVYLEYAALHYSTPFTAFFLPGTQSSAAPEKTAITIGQPSPQATAAMPTAFTSERVSDTSTIPAVIKKYVISQGLHMRSAAGTQSFIVKTLKRGDEVIVLDQKQAIEDTLWVKVRVGNIEGWVNQAYIK